MSTRIEEIGLALNRLSPSELAVTVSSVLHGRSTKYSRAARGAPDRETILVSATFNTPPLKPKLEQACTFVATELSGEEIKADPNIAADLLWLSYRIGAIEAIPALSKITRNRDNDLIKLPGHTESLRHFGIRSLRWTLSEATPEDKLRARELIRAAK